MSSPVQQPEIRPIDPANMNPRLNGTHVTDGAGLDKVARYFQRIFDAKRPEFTIDTEFNVVPDIRWHERRLRTIQVGDRDEQYTIDLLAFAGSEEALIAGQGGRPLEPSAWAKPIVDVLRPVLDTNAFLKIGQQLQVEYEMLSYCLGIYMWHLHDTLLAEKLLWAGAVPFHMPGFWGLEDLVRRYMHLEISKDEQKTFDLSTPLTERQLIYTYLDCRLPFGIKAAQVNKLEQTKQQWAHRIDCDAIPAFGDMHVSGFMLDRGEWQKIIDDKRAEHKENVTKMDAAFLPIVGPKPTIPSDEELNRLEESYTLLTVRSAEENAINEQLAIKGQSKLEKDLLREKRNALEAERKKQRAASRVLYNAAAHTRTKKFREDYSKMEGEAAINYGSGPQLLKAFNKIKGLEKLKSTKDDDLKKHRGVPAIDALLAYRKTDKFLDSFGEKMFDFINELTGRIHAYCNLYGAETGRTTMSKPNLQQIPKDKKYRAAFRARPGWKIITIDYSGCELRIIADFSGDVIWIEAFNKDEDIHSIVASMMWKIDWETNTLEMCDFKIRRKKCSCPVHKDKRDKAKAPNFGTAYGMTKYKLADELGCSVEEADKLLRLWHVVNKHVSEWLDKTGKQAKMKGEARTGSGRRRLLPKPDWEVARKAAKADLVAKLMERGVPEEEALRTEPTGSYIQHKLQALLGGLERQGRNTPIQGTNADMIKLALGCGFDKQGVPYEWHYLRPDKGNGLLVNMVHDEQVIEAPEDRAEKTYEVAGDAMQRAGAEFIKAVPMTYEGKIALMWSK